MPFKDKLNHIDSLQLAIKQHGQLPDEILKKINYKFRLEWNYTSNNMEGNSLTKQETRSVMVGNITVAGKPIKDVLEMKGHDDLITDIIKIGKAELNITEKRIKDIHKAIMHEEDAAKSIYIGRWKADPNYLFNYKNERFDFASPADVPEKMHNLINWLNTQKEKIKQGTNPLHPVELAFQFHLDYIAIHPFYDGNGRTSRILTNLILIAYGYPPIYIKENEKDIYYQYLADIQGYGGNAELFFEFMSELLIRSQQIIIDAIEGKDITDPDDIRKEILLLKKKISNDTVRIKSPSLIYNIFSKFESEALSIFISSLSQFDYFFSESRESHYFNGLEERIEMPALYKTLLSSTLEEIETAKIFGKDIYKSEINNLEWRIKKFGLKNAIHKTDFEIAFSLFFYKSEYSFLINLDTKNIFTLKKEYGQFLSNEEIIIAKDQLVKAFLELIKGSMKE